MTTSIERGSLIYPYYVFYSYDNKGLHNSEYYPNELKSNPNKTRAIIED